MKTLACIKRVPDTGAEIVLTEDKQSVDASAVGYTMGPHEECAIEQSVQVVEEEGGEATVLSLGHPDTDEQIYEGIGRGADEGVLLETDGGDWGPESTATAIADAIEQDLEEFDLLFFGNESGDNANHQVGIRVAHMLDLPVVTGAKDFELDGETATVKRDIPGGSEVFEVDLPAVVTVKEGLNTPRYPSMRSRMQAKKQEIEVIEPTETEDAVQMVELETPERADEEAEVLGEGPEAVDEAVSVLEELEVI